LEEQMSTDTIRRDVLIAAPLDVVWRTVTEPDQITRWFSDAAQVDLQPGGEGVLTFEGTASGKPQTVPISVVHVDEPHRFAFRWMHPDGAEAHQDNSLLVEFTLAAEGAGTRLQVTESGLDRIGWAAEQVRGYTAEHEDGWQRHLGQLAELHTRQAGVSAGR
jgi:uncharacterized protein YndB with AHSA1/START domain